MEFLIILIVLAFIIFYLIRPTSKSELKIQKKDNWLTWDFKKIQLTKIDCNLFEVLLIDC